MNQTKRVAVRWLVYDTNAVSNPTFLPTDYAHQSRSFKRADYYGLRLVPVFRSTITITVSMGPRDPPRMRWSCRKEKVRHQRRTNEVYLFFIEKFAATSNDASD